MAFQDTGLEETATNSLASVKSHSQGSRANEWITDV